MHYALPCKQDSQLFLDISRFSTTLVMIDISLCQIVVEKIMDIGLWIWQTADRA
jgi:hypothetical protein